MSELCLDFVTVDVFSTATFGGNPLAVFFAVPHLTDQQMQQIAAEMNYSETTFVLPPADQANTANIRIFTPVAELPFAGHPNVGTGYVLAGNPSAVPAEGVVTSQVYDSSGRQHQKMRFEERAGLVEVVVEMLGQALPGRASISPPQNFQHRPGHSVVAMANALGLRTDQIVARDLGSDIVSVGIEFPVVEVVDLGALEACRANPSAFAQLSLYPDDLSAASSGLDEAFLVYVYCRTEQRVVRARMFDPLHGIPEDPATGSAAGALVGLLASRDQVQGSARYEVLQGHEIRRPSRITVDLLRDNGQVLETHISGDCVEVIRGRFTLPAVPDIQQTEE